MEEIHVELNDSDLTDTSPLKAIERIVLEALEAVDKTEFARAIVAEEGDDV